MKIPTDLQILDAIHTRYYSTFCDFTKGKSERTAKIYVPIDCAEIAKQLSVDPDIIFGRLYLHLEEKYGYRKADNSIVHFFALEIGKDRHCINFPLLSSVLAAFRDEHKKFWTATGIAVVALIVSVISLAMSFE